MVGTPSCGGCCAATAPAAFATTSSEHIALAQELGRRVDEHPTLERIAPVSFALMCFRHVEGDAATDALAEAINATGTLYVISSQIDGTRFVRISVGQTHTTHMDVERLWSAISAGARGAS